jgi:hypothetical protein
MGIISHAPVKGNQRIEMDEANLPDAPKTMKVYTFAFPLDTVEKMGEMASRFGVDMLSTRFAG